MEPGLQIKYSSISLQPLNRKAGMPEVKAGVQIRNEQKYKEDKEILKNLIKVLEFIKTRIPLQPLKTVEFIRII